MRKQIEIALCVNKGKLDQAKLRYRFGRFCTHVCDAAYKTKVKTIILLLMT